VTPTTIVHGSDDAIVPPLVSESYVAAHSRVPLIGVAEAAHFALIDPQAAAWSIVMRELAAAQGSTVAIAS
jgi:pimeloyl-ACP methyl ester carboxylesterase